MIRCDRGWRRETDDRAARAQRIAELAPGAREAVLSRLFAEYSDSPANSPSPGRVLDAIAPVSDESDRAGKTWDWRTDASEWELKSLTTALGLPSVGSRVELVAAVQKQLNDLAEPAEQLSVSLNKLARIMNNNERTPALRLGSGDDIRLARAKVLTLMELARAQAQRVLDVDPFKAMQSRELGPCVLDLAYLYMDFVHAAFDTMMPLLRAEAVGALEAGTHMTQQLNRCMFLIFKVIGTSTNEGNLYDPRRAGRFLIELGKLRRAWRMNCGFIQSLNDNFEEIVKGLDNSMDGDDSDGNTGAIDPDHIIQLTPLALTELHESYHGPPTHTLSTSRDDTNSDSPASWSAVWQAVSGASSPARHIVRDASTGDVDQVVHMRETDMREVRMSGSDAPRGSDGDEGTFDDAIPLNNALEAFDQERRRDNVNASSSLANFALRARRFEMLPFRRMMNASHDAPGTFAPSASAIEISLSQLPGGIPGVGNSVANQVEEDIRPTHLMEWMHQSNLDAPAVRATGTDDSDTAADPAEARMHAYRLASSTRVHARLTFTERGHPVRVPATSAIAQPVSQARLREATSITRLVTNLSTRLRSVSTPLLDTGKSKTKSPNTIKLFEHIARWELLGYSNSKELSQLGCSKPGLLCERLAKQSAMDGRWCAVLGRALTVHCMPMQICIMNGLVSEVNGEFHALNAPASMFCTAVTVVLRMVLQAYLEGGQVPKLRAENWWKTLAHLGDVLICWGTGANGISATFPHNGNAGRHEMSDVVSQAILAGLSMEDSEFPQYTFGKLFALVAPQLLHDLADANVSPTVVDSVSGLCFMFARIICDAAKDDGRWVEAIEVSQATLPAQLRKSLAETAAWAKQVRSTVENAGTACEGYMNKTACTPSDEPVVSGMEFLSRANARKGVRLGVLLALCAAISQVSGKRVKSSSSVVVPIDDEVEVKQEDRCREKTTKTTRRITRSDNVVDLDPVVAALNDCVSSLACIATPMAILGWAFDGGNKGIRGGLNLLGNSRWLSETQGEFPVYSPVQQIVDMTQLLLHCFAELRPSGTSASNAVNALLTDPKWHKTFSMFQAVSPNMFYFGSSLDLIGASADVFPHAFKISRLRKDLKRHAAEFQNASSISMVLDRASPCHSAWRAINSLCRRALVGRSLNASFEGEDGLGDGVNREALQILVDTLARGAPNKPSEAVLCDMPSYGQGTSGFLTLRPDAPLPAAMFFGKVIGLIISSNVNVVLPLAPWIWSALLGKRGTLSQLAAVDEEFGRTLMTLNTHSISHQSNKWVAMSELNFVRTVRLPNGALSEFELVPGGRDIAVTDANRKQFVQTYAWSSMEMVNGESIETVAQAARKGVCDVIPAELLSSLSPVDLERMVCGLPKISIEAWRKATIYEPKVASPEEERRVEWFWQAIESFSSSDQALLLHFWAAYTHLPHSGFEGLNFKVRFDDKLSTDHLPMAQTCFLTLRIPKYVSAEQFSMRLLHAVRTGSSGFGFA